MKEVKSGKHWKHGLMWNDEAIEKLTLQQFYVEVERRILAEQNVVEPEHHHLPLTD
ncbi:hypothetical protein OH690_05100 [Escherichia coli]|nr:hypothetical protein [Escherichia coli]